MDKKTYVINGKPWTGFSLAAHCKITPSAARNRLRKWLKGEATLEDLFHEGKRHAGGNQGRTSATHATPEYKALDDTAKSMKPIDCTPGTWEREHIKPKENRRYVSANVAPERESIYYNPMRIAL